MSQFDFNRAVQKPKNQKYQQENSAKYQNLNQLIFLTCFPDGGNNHINIKMTSNVSLLYLYKLLFLLTYLTLDFTLEKG
jgi:hypothetical protein